MASCVLWEIDDGVLSYYYVSQSTDYGVYYTLKQPTPGYPEGFYASERDFEMASHNQQMRMVQTSGNEALTARGKRVDDDTTLPSERIASAANANNGRVISSGNESKARRKKYKS